MCEGRLCIAWLTVWGLGLGALAAEVAKARQKVAQVAALAARARAEAAPARAEAAHACAEASRAREGTP